MAIPGARGGGGTAGDGRARDEGALRPGTRLRSYQLVNRLAIGATSEVWLAKLTGAQGFEKIVVLKVIAADPARRGELADLLTNEATIGARLYHPGIVHLLDFAQADARCFISMEHLDGVNLLQAAVRLGELGQRFPLPLVVYVAGQVCRGLHYAHELADSKGSLGFLHRGISPDNVMLLRSGAVKLIDFGASRMRSVPTPPSSVGTQTHYAAPERLNDREEDRRSDIYSLGVVLYQILCGQRPFEGDDDVVRARVLEGRPASPTDVAPDLPEGMAQVVLRAMSRDPDKRQPTAEALSTDLQAAYEEHLAIAPDSGHDELELRIGLNQIFGNGLNGANEVPGSMPLRIIARATSAARSLGSEPVALAPAAPIAALPLLVGGDPPAEPGWTQDDTTEPCSMPLPVEEPASSPPARAPGPGSMPGAVPEPIPTQESAPVPVSALFDGGTSSGRRVPTVYWLKDEVGADLTGSVFDVALTRVREPSINFVPREISGFGEKSGVADIFAIRRRGEAAESGPRHQAWITPEPPPTAASAGPAPPAPEDRRTPRQLEAARCFDRGLAFLTDKQYGLALDEWERAIELDPYNRTYQTNLKRLRARHNK